MTRLSSLDLFQGMHHEAVQHQPGGPGWQRAPAILRLWSRQTQRGNSHKPEPNHSGQRHQVDYFFGFPFSLMLQNLSVFSTFFLTLQRPSRCCCGKKGGPHSLQRLGSHQVAAVCTGGKQSNCHGKLNTQRYWYERKLVDMRCPKLHLALSKWFI